MSFLNFINTINSTSWQTTSRPKYVLLINATPEETKLLTTPIVWPHYSSSTLTFEKISEDIFVTLDHYSSIPLTQLLSQKLGHNNFVLAELCACPSLLKQMIDE